MWRMLHRPESLDSKRPLGGIGGPLFRLVLRLLGEQDFCNGIDSTVAFNTMAEDNIGSQFMKAYIFRINYVDRCATVFFIV